MFNIVTGAVLLQNRPLSSRLYIITLSKPVLSQHSYLFDEVLLRLISPRRQNYAEVIYLIVNFLTQGESLLIKLNLQPKISELTTCDKPIERHVTFNT